MSGRPLICGDRPGCLEGEGHGLRERRLLPSPRAGAGQAGAGQARREWGEPGWRWGWGPSRRRGRLEEPRLRVALLLGGQRAELSTLAAGGPAPVGHGQPVAGGPRPRLTARVTPTRASAPRDPGCLPEAALAAQPLASGAQS